VRSGTAASQDVILRALDNCVTTAEYVDRNANLALAIQNWCESLADGAAVRA
jgi:hypothetical protein